jgi:hypothetical protein
MAHLYLMKEAWVGVPGVKPPILLSQKFEQSLPSLNPVALHTQL